MDEIAELEKLAELKNKKVINDDEFNQLKKKVMENNLVADEPKNGVAYVLLATFLGNFGIHNFYAGYIKRAVTQLMLTLFSWVLLFLPLFAVQIWAILDMCLINKDVHGVPFVGDKTLIKLIRIAVVALVGLGYLIIVVGILVGLLTQTNVHAAQIIQYY